VEFGLWQIVTFSSLKSGPLSLKSGGPSENAVDRTKICLVSGGKFFF